MEHVIAAAALGFLGSAHCAGMCGGFFMLAGRGQLSRQSQYLFGKTLSYAVLGTVAGSLGAGVAMLVPFRTGLSIAAGILLILIGLAWIGILPTASKISRLQAKVAGQLGRVLRRTGKGAPFLIGLSNGMLPCGLLYGGLGLAASTLDPVSGAATMTSFGLGTIPGLIAFGIVARKLSHPALRNSQVLGGVLMVLFGAITLLRIFATGEHAMH